MLRALGWIVVRSSREAYVGVASTDAGLTNDSLALLDDIDESVKAADRALFEELQQFLSSFDSFDLTWHFIPKLNNHAGILHVASSRNHRGAQPAVVKLLEWLSSRGPGSYGLVYIHDDEDAGEAGCVRGRSGRDYSGVFRVWRLQRGKVDELDDPFLSPLVPGVDPVAL